MGQTQISGEAFPLVIDQSDIDAPDFPRSEQWWQRFMPIWVTATLREDGTVALEYNGRNPFDYEAGTFPSLTAAELRRGRAGMARWVTRALGPHLKATANHS